MDVGSDFVEPDLLGDALAAGSVFGARLVVEYRVDFFEGETLELRVSGWRGGVEEHLGGTKGKRRGRGQRDARMEDVRVGAPDSPRAI